MLTTPLKLIRYLIELRINRSLVWLPPRPEREFAWRWGTLVAAQMPIVRARAWKKALARGLEEPDEPPLWPAEAVLRLRISRRTFGMGEPIFLELKLMGEAADHGFFMETMLPALEILGYATAPSAGPNPLWGHFEIRSVRSARGRTWKPLIRDGRLDLRFKVNAGQWEKGLRPPECRPQPVFRLAWRTPYHSAKNGNRSAPSDRPPELPELLEETARRLGRILHGPRTDAREFVSRMDADCAGQWNRALEAAAGVRTTGWHPVRSYSASAGLLGEQTFAPEIPPALFPFLALGQLVHLGEGTLYGHGAFGLV
jgi:hypothetical protein